MTYDMFAASQPKIPKIDLGLNDAILSRVETKWVTGGQYGDGFVTQDESGNDINRFKWVYALTADDGSVLYDEESGFPLEVDQLTGLQFFAKAKNPSKQVRAMKALMTADEFDAWSEGKPAPSLNELLGRPVQVDVGLNDNMYPTASSVLGPRKGQRARAVATAE